MKEEFTKEELSAIRSIRRAFKRCPGTLRLYSTGSDLIMCKVGADSCLNESIISDGLNAGVIIYDMHEANNNGENNSPIR